MENLHDKRKVYDKFQLIESQVEANPFEMFLHWMKEAEEASGILEANAMNVATMEADNGPRIRTVLLKAYSEEGFVFYTNYNSRKGNAIDHNPKACLHFFWPSLERQITIKANLVKTTSQNSDDYFHSRPRGSQLGAVASPQSSIVAGREFLEESLAAAEQKFEGKEIERPEHWGGYLAVPYEIEFWQGRPNRLHDRIIYNLSEANNWEIHRLAP